MPPANAWPDSLMMGFSPDDPPRTLPLDDRTTFFLPLPLDASRHIGGTKLNFGAPSDRIVSDLKPCFQFLPSSSPALLRQQTSTTQTSNVVDPFPVTPYDMTHTLPGPSSCAHRSPWCPPFLHSEKKCAHMSCAVSLTGCRFDHDDSYKTPTRLLGTVFL